MSNIKCQISNSEWRWVAVIGVVILCIFSLPYVVGLLTSTRQMSFSGFLFGLEDMYSYIAKMRYGARDGWLFELVYTSEPHQGGFVFAPFLGLGKLVALITGQGGSVTAEALIAAYHVARVLCGGLLLAVVYRFVAEFLADVSRRRLAWCIAMLSGGLGWLPVAVNQPGGMPPIELYVPEAFSTLLLFGLPHLSLARALLLAGWLALWQAADTTNWKWAGVAGLAWLGMGLMVPFYIALLGVLIAAWLAALAVTRRQIPWPQLCLAALAGTLPLCLLLYNTWLFTSNPIFSIWSSQNSLPSPSPVSYLLAYGVLLAAGIPGAYLVWRQGLTHRSVLLIVWPLAAAILVYLPINVQRRLLEGVIVPLSVLATLGIWLLVSERRWPVRLTAAAGMLILLLPSTVILVGGGMLTASRTYWPIFHPADERAALHWLHDRAPADSVVLSSRVSGSLLPAYAGVRTYLGHGPETVNAIQKEGEVEAFFSDGMTDEERQHLLVEGRIAYIWIGHIEREILCTGTHCFDPASLELNEVYHQGDYTVYEVAR